MASGTSIILRGPVQNAPKNPVLDRLQKNLMVELDERRRALVAGGKRLFDFGLGDPREPTPEFVKAALRSAVPDVSQYPSAFGSLALRRAAAGYLTRRFGVSVDPDTQVLACAGAKEAIFHLPLAFAGDPRRRKVVIPDPGYPTYEVGARLAGLEPVLVPLTAKRRFLLDPEDVGEEVLRETVVFWVSYPHNPTGAVAPRDDAGQLERVLIRRRAVDRHDQSAQSLHFGRLYTAPWGPATGGRARPGYNRPTCTLSARTRQIPTGGSAPPHRPSLTRSSCVR
jgi:acetylornithine aminotransferase